jgi:hypothetical protein
MQATVRKPIAVPLTPTIAQIAPEFASTLKGVTIPNDMKASQLPTASDFAHPNDFDKQPSSK